MKKHKWNLEKISLIGINLVYLLALAVVLLPLLLVAKYNFPSGDDWSYGAKAYKALAEGGGLLDVLKCSFEVMAHNYVNWEGRFSNSFLASLQPGIWGEQYYCVVPWIMLGGLIGGEMILAATLVNAGKQKGEETDKECKWLWIPVIVPTLLMQLLYTPSTVESFYWYTGAVNYTFMFGLSMVLFALYYKLAQGEATGWKLGLQVVAASLLAVLIGGDNFATSLSTAVAMVIICVLLWIYHRKGFYRTWYLPVLTGGSLLACIFAPGNMSRLTANYDGTTTGKAAEAIWVSLVRSCTNIYSWTNIKIVLMILLIVPFAWRAVKDIKFDFKWPGVFTLLSFGVYATQITATLYVDGTTGGGRMAAILYYSYHMWLVLNTCYWLGWVRRACTKWPVALVDGLKRVWSLIYRFILPYCAVVGVLLAGAVYATDMKEISVYKTYRDWKQGWAQQYAAEWEERLVILNDPTVTEVVFEPLSVHPESYMYTDLQDEKGYIWVNRDCATYYGKESIIVVSEP